MANNDITALLYRIKDNIRAIEGGDTREPLLDEVRSDFLDLIELIKLCAGLVGIQLNLPRSLAHLPLSALLFGAHLIGRAVLLRR